MYVLRAGARVCVSDGVEYLFPASLGPVFARRTFPFLFATRARNFALQRCGPHFPDDGRQKIQTSSRTTTAATRSWCQEETVDAGRRRATTPAVFSFAKESPPVGDDGLLSRCTVFREIFATFPRHSRVHRYLPHLSGLFPCILFGRPTDGRAALSTPFAPSMEMGTRETLSRDHSIHFPGPRDDPA